MGFQPFEQVLVRNIDTDLWLAAVFARVVSGKFWTSMGVYDQCIPYKGNENICDTTTPPNQGLCPGDLMLVRDALNEAWTIRVFQTYFPDREYAFGDTEDSAWCHAIPYHGNERLLNTTLNNITE